MRLRNKFKALSSTKAQKLWSLSHEEVIMRTTGFKNFGKGGRRIMTFENADFCVLKHLKRGKVVYSFVVKWVKRCYKSLLKINFNPCVD